MYQTLYYQGIKNYRIYNPGTKIGKKAKFLCNFKKSLYLCTRLTAIRSESIAQQVEHNTFNVGVLGSSPKRITRKSESYTKVTLFFYA